LLLSQDVFVTIPQGTLMGEWTSSGILQPRYNSFKGIPYATPPVGNLRFRAPQPHTGWTGTLNAQAHRPHCPSGGWFGIDEGELDEDCLFLNVYSPSLTGSRGVLVWIHGGSFDGGSGDSGIYGPDFLVAEGAVVVTINYRLGVLGMLSTGDGAAQGNYAMKDMVLALEWVRNNIANFGGNPNQVTVFGESAGSAAVSVANQSSNPFIDLFFVQPKIGSLSDAIANEPRRKLIRANLIALK